MNFNNTYSFMMSTYDIKAGFSEEVIYYNSALKLCSFLYLCESSLFFNEWFVSLKSVIPVFRQDEKGVDYDAYKV